MQTLTPKHDRLLITFLLLGIVILAFILTPLLSMVCGQIISNRSGMIDAIGLVK